MPVSKIVKIFSFFAVFNAFKTLALVPLVDIPINTSPFFPRAWICLEKIWSKLKSLAIEVIIEESVVRAMADRGLRTFLNLVYEKIKKKLWL